MHRKVPRSWIRVCTAASAAAFAGALAWLIVAETDVWATASAMFDESTGQGAEFWGRVVRPRLWAIGRLLILAVVGLAAYRSSRRAPEGPEGRPSVRRLLLSALLLLVGFLVLLELKWPDRLAMRMDGDGYGRRSLLAEALRRAEPRDLAMVLAVCVPPLLAIGRLRWGEVDPGRVLRPVVWAAVLPLAFAFSAYNYNYYHDQGHLFDRLLVAALGLATLAHPGFVPSFVSVTSLVMHQFEHPPMVKYSDTDKGVLFDLLLLWSVHLGLRLADRRLGPRPFLLVGFCLLASHYVHSGLGKLAIGWFGEEDISYLFVAAYNHGWLGWLGEPAMLRAREVLSLLNGPMMVFTLIAEVGVLFALWHRRLAIAALFALITLHLGIFLASGILFWKWIAVDAGFILAFRGLDPVPEAPSPGRWAVPACSSLLILLAPLLWDAHRLAWYDSPVTIRYEFNAIGASGRVSEVAPVDFAPYDFPIAQGRFYHLEETPDMVNTYGQVYDGDRERLHAILALRTPEDLLAYRETLSPKERYAYEPEALERFISRWFAHVNRHGRSYRPPSVALPPQHIWTAPVGGPRFDWREPITSVRVRRLEVFFDGRRRHVVSDDVVREVAIPGPP